MLERPLDDALTKLATAEIKPYGRWRMEDGSEAELQRMRWTDNWIARWLQLHSLFFSAASASPASSLGRHTPQR